MGYNTNCPGTEWSQHPWGPIRGQTAVCLFTFHFFHHISHLVNDRSCQFWSSVSSFARQGDFETCFVYYIAGGPETEEGGFIWGSALYIRSTVWMRVDVYGPEERWRAMMHTVKLLFVVFSCLCAVAWASSNRQPCRKRFIHSLSYVIELICNIYALFIQCYNKSLFFKLSRIRIFCIKSVQV